jgi:putative FmdB family regulatory protein
MFEYVCEACGQLFERLVPGDQADDQRHESCGQRAIRRPSSPAFSVAGYNAKNGYAMKGLVANPKYPGKQAS